MTASDKTGPKAAARKPRATRPDAGKHMVANPAAAAPDGGKPVAGKLPASFGMRRAAMRPLAAMLPTLMKAATGRRGFGEGSILTDWASIVGAELAAQSAPEKLAFPGGDRRAGVLQLRVAGPLAIEIQHLAPLILERVNTHFGYPAVARLRILQGPLPRRPRRPDAPSSGPLTDGQEAQLAGCLTQIGDAGLRQALDGLGRAVLAGRTSSDN
jgi:hypothetical protein